MNEHMRTNSGIEDITTELAVLGEQIDRETAEQTQIKKDAESLARRFRSNPGELALFNEKNDSHFENADEIVQHVQNRDHLGIIENFFTWCDQQPKDEPLPDDPDSILD